jgi:anti-anti-sigma factor
MLEHVDETLAAVTVRPDVGTVVVGYQDGVGVLTLLGEHDMSSAGRLFLLICQQADLGRGVVVVLSETEFIDSGIVRVLFQGDLQMLRNGRRLVIQNDAQAPVERVLQLCGVRTQLLCSDTLDEAIRLATQRYLEH